MKRVLVIGLAVMVIAILTACGDKESAPLTFTVASNTVSVGQEVTITFSEMLPAQEAAERYWITIAAAGSPDGEWGTWQYVDEGAANITLTAPAAGAYEIRLHTKYPTIPNNIVYRLPLVVQ